MWWLPAVIAMWCVQALAYEVMVFGDTHYDSPEVRTGTENLTAARRKELNRNLDCWRQSVPEMLRAAGGRSGQDVAFAVHLGDMIQGDCGSRTLQEQSCRNALAIFRKNLACPFYALKGNHDVRGEGAKAGYDAVMLPYLNRAIEQSGDAAGAANYALMHDRDLYIFFDCMKPDLKFVATTLTAHPDARYVFFLTHFPVIPCTRGYADIVFYRPENRPEERAQLLKLLAERHAVVLCGHIHRTVFTRYRSPEGTVVQLTNFSLVPPRAAHLPIPARGDGTAFFANPIIAGEMSKQTPAGKMLEEFTGKIETYADYSTAPGFNILRITDDGIAADIHHRGAANPTTTFKLTP